MISLLQWIWGGIKSLGKSLLKVWAALWNVLSSAVTWIVGLVYYIIDTLWDWLSEKIGAFFDSIGDLISNSPVDGDVFQVGSLATHLADIFVLDVALECAAYLLLAFITARLLRLIVIPVRALLEIL